MFIHISWEKINKFHSTYKKKIVECQSPVILMILFAPKECIVNLFNSLEVSLFSYNKFLAVNHIKKYF